MKFILGGRMGDLIHAMWVVKNTPGIHDLYITDRRDLHSDGFVHSIEKTMEELGPDTKAAKLCKLIPGIQRRDGNKP